MWASFIIWILTATEWKGSENSHIDIILHYFSNTSKMIHKYPELMVQAKQAVKKVQKDNLA